MLNREKELTFLSEIFVSALLYVALEVEADGILVIDFDSKYLLWSDNFLTSFLCCPDLAGLPLGLADIVVEEIKWKVIIIRQDVKVLEEMNEVGECIREER